jgi:hypothetical protein
MSKQQQILEQKELTVSQILRTYGTQFTQIKELYSDGHNGRCAVGVIMSYYGWDGNNSDASDRFLPTIAVLECNGIDENLIIRLNDSGSTFDEIADYLDQHY